MKTSISFALLLSVVLLSGFTVRNGMLPEWENLGSRKVNFSLDRDVIPVTYRDGYLTAIKIEVTRGPMNMHRCVVHFENGTKQEVELRHSFAAGSESRVVDLNGGKRYIKEIEFWYDTKDFSGSKALVTVWGRK